MNKDITIEIVRRKHTKVYEVDENDSVYRVKISGIFKSIFNLFRSHFTPVEASQIVVSRETECISYDTIYECIYEQLTELVEYGIEPSLIIVGESLLDIDGDYDIVSRETLIHLNTYISNQSNMVKIDKEVQLRIVPHLNQVIVV